MSTEERSARDERRYDPYTPHWAQVLDYLLGGKDNYECDRALAQRIRTEAPDVLLAVRSAREFLLRAVEYLITHRHVHQIVELGSGFPVPPTVPGIAQHAHPHARTLCVDHDAVVAAHGRAFLNDARSVMLQADLTDTDTIVERIGRIMDLTQPLAISLSGVLEFVEHPQPVLSALIDALPTGTYVVLTHLTPDLGVAGAAEHGAEIFRQAGIAVWPRRRAEITALLAGCEPIGPEWDCPHRWWPGSEIEQRRRQSRQWAPPPDTDTCCVATLRRIR